MANCVLFAGFLIVVNIVQNAADMSCHLSGVTDEPKKYTYPLWGKDIVRDCPESEVFDAEKCRCTTKELEAHKILNGKKADVKDVPWVLSVWATCIITKGESWTKNVSSKDGICTAALVRPRWALTALHCKKNPTKFCVVKGLPAPYTSTIKYSVEGGTSVEGKGVRSNVLKIYYHKTKIDIMLLHLDTAIQDSDANNIKPLPVAKPGSDFYGKRCIIAAFGNQVYGRKDGHLYQAGTTLLKRRVQEQECPYGLLDKGQTKEPWHICAYDEKRGADLCSADSGSALVCPDEQNVNTAVGILSKAAGNCAGSWYSVWSSTEMVYDWMIETIHEVEGKGSE